MRLITFVEGSNPGMIEYAPGSLEISDRRDVPRLTVNSLERVLNLAIEVCEHSSHRDAQTAYEDLKELKSIAVQLWVAAQNAIFAKENGVKPDFTVEAKPAETKPTGNVDRAMRLILTRPNFTPSQEDHETLRKSVINLFADGWEDSEVVRYLRYTEEAGCNEATGISEEAALERMKQIRESVERRIGKILPACWQKKDTDNDV